MACPTLLPTGNCEIGSVMDELISRCLQSDKSGWVDFVGTYAGLILSTVRRVLRTRGAEGQELAEDVVQDVFLRLIRDDFHLLRSYDGGRASLRTWLTIVARSMAIDVLRRKRLPTVRLEDAAPVTAAAEPEPSIEHEQAISIGPGVLTERQRQVVHLLFDREMSPEAASELLDISVQTVRSTKHKAINKLRQYYGQEDSS